MSFCASERQKKRMWSCGFAVKEALFLCALLSLFTLPHAFTQGLCSERTNLGSRYQYQQVKTQNLAYDGPGSYPPRCTGKCGDCTPCVPVRIPVPPGTPVIAEYYPEAWRCKCGNKLYLPSSYKQANLPAGSKSICIAISLKFWFLAKLSRVYIEN